MASRMTAWCSVSASAASSLASARATTLRCGNPLPLNAVESCSMPCWVSSGRSSSCRTRTYSQLVDEVGQVVAVDDLPARALRKREVVGDFGVRQDDDVVPAQPALRPAGVLLDEVAQRVAGFAGLADGFDLVFVAAALLPPASRRRARPRRP